MVAFYPDTLLYNVAIDIIWDISRQLHLSLVPSDSQGSNVVRKSTVHFLFDQEYTKFERKISLCQGFFFSLSKSSSPSFVPPIFILLKKIRTNKLYNKKYTTLVELFTINFKPVKRNKR